MRIVVGADTRGLLARHHISRLLRESGHEVDVVDGTEEAAAEYPDAAAIVAQEVRQGKADRGILIARPGMGMCIVANKFSGIRAAVSFAEFMAEMSRRYLAVNDLCLSAELLDKDHAEQIVEIWLNTPFEGGRHARRIDRISALEPQGSTVEPDSGDQ